MKTPKKLVNDMISKDRWFGPTRTGVWRPKILKDVKDKTSEE